MRTSERELPKLPYVLASPKHRLAGLLLGFGISISIGILGGIFAVIVGELSLAYVIAYTVYPIWTLSSWRFGQNPYHRILKMRVYSIDTGLPARWRHMALRIMTGVTLGIIGAALVIYSHITLIAVGVQGSNGVVTQIHALVSHPLALIVAAIYSIGLTMLDGLWIFKSGKNQRLIDMLARTVVLNESVQNPEYSPLSDAFDESESANGNEHLGDQMEEIE